MKNLKRPIRTSITRRIKKKNPKNQSRQIKAKRRKKRKSLRK